MDKNQQRTEEKILDLGEFSDSGNKKNKLVIFLIIIILIIFGAIVFISYHSKEAEKISAQSAILPSQRAKQSPNINELRLKYDDLQTQKIVEEITEATEIIGNSEDTEEKLVINSSDFEFVEIQQLENELDILIEKLENI